MVVSTQTPVGVPPAPGAPGTGGPTGSAGPGTSAPPPEPTLALTATCAATGPIGICAPAPPAPAGGAVPPAPPDGYVVAALARDQLDLPLPDVRTAPPPGVDQVVAFATWLWIDPTQWHGLSKTVMIPGVAATVAARPVSMTWQTGDGQTVECRGPGTPYLAGRPDAGQHSDCTHAYLDRGAVAGRVTVHWQMDWSATTGQAGTFGLVDRTTDLRLIVVEVQAVTD